MRRLIVLALLLLFGGPAQAWTHGAGVVRVQKNLVLNYGATCDGVADDTSAFLTFKAAFQSSTPVTLAIPGFCTFLPTGGAGQFPFKGIGNLIVAGIGAASSGIKNIAGASQNFLFGGSGEAQDNAHSLRTNDAAIGDSCVTVKTAPAVTVSNVVGSLAFTSVFTASASGTTLNVTAVTSGTILPGAIIGNLDSSPGFFNTIQPYGTAGTTGTGGTGTYALSTTATFTSQTTNTAPASFTATVDANGLMTVTAVADGTLTVGAAVFSASGGIGGTGGISTGITKIKSLGTGTGGTGTYQLDNSPSAAISSPVAFQLQGFVRVTLNSTSGLTTGDTIFLTGMTGRGQLPQRANGLKWIKVIDGTHIELFQWVFDGGYTSGGTGGGDRTSIMPVGSKVMMTGWTNQSYWGAPFGFPSNPHWFEYKTVTSTNSGTHQICFDSPLANAYKSTWPQYNTGSLFEVDPGGPATLYVLDPSWELTHVYQDITIDNPSFQTTANGRNITYKNVTVTGVNCIIPTQNETNTWINVSGSGCNIETDKIVGTWSISGSTTLHKVDVQSSSMGTIAVDGLTINQWFGGPKTLNISNSTFTCSGCGAGTPGLSFGTLAYGMSDESICANCNVGNLVNNSGPIQRVDDPTHPWSMSGGVITIPNSYSFNGCCNASEIQTRGLIPGHYAVWQGSQIGRVFKIVDVTQDVDNTFVTTNEVGGFPTGAWSASGLSVAPHPAPKLTTSGMSGSDSALSFNGCTALPMFSCQNFTYIGGAAGTTAGYKPILWGELSSFTFANNVPYTNTGALTWQQSQFGNWSVLKTDLTLVSYGTSPNGQTILNTKLPATCSPASACVRSLINPGPATNTQTGDTITMPPTGALFGGASASGPVFSANTPSDSPQVTIQLLTNQHLPYLLKRDLDPAANDNSPTWLNQVG